MIVLQIACIFASHVMYREDTSGDIARVSPWLKVESFVHFLVHGPCVSPPPPVLVAKSKQHNTSRLPLWNYGGALILLELDFMFYSEFSIEKSDRVLKRLIKPNTVCFFTYKF